MSIGAAIARGLAEAGADVAVQTARPIDEAMGLGGAVDAVVDEIGGLGRVTGAIDADLAVPGAGRRIVEQASAILGEVDILVICASVQQRSPFEAVSDKELARQFEINFATSIDLLQAAVPSMATRGWGRVLSIGSINQVRPEPQLAVYAALKAAQHNLIANLAKVHAADGVTLNTLSPGLVATERNRWRREDADDWRRIQAEANPMGRAGDPEEMVGAALLLCSDAGRFITGVDLQAAGGAQL
jgi:NAD(P)-dependent dehydrogenase (short-subunit alcohol dehydrogenase family)